MGTSHITGADVAAMPFDHALKCGLEQGIAAGSHISDVQHNVPYGDIPGLIAAATDLLGAAGVTPQDCLSVEAGNSVAGIILLLALMRLPERLDTLLLVSNAIANLIGGLSKLGLGLLQLFGVLLLVGVVLLALAFLAGGLVRLARALLRSKAATPPSPR